MESDRQTAQLVDSHDVAYAVLELQRTTVLLIRALTDQLRSPCEMLAKEIARLEALRDQQHERLSQLEALRARQSAQRARAVAESQPPAR